MAPRKSAGVMGPSRYGSVRNSRSILLAPQSHWSIRVAVTLAAVLLLVSLPIFSASGSSGLVVSAVALFDRPFWSTKRIMEELGTSKVFDVKSVLKKIRDGEMYAQLPFWRIPKLRGPIDPRLPAVERLQEDARKIFPMLELLKEHKFFRIFKADLSRECPFWARSRMCTSNGACVICECDEHHIPQPWKMNPVEDFVDRRHYNASDAEPWGQAVNDLSPAPSLGGTSAWRSSSTPLGVPMLTVSDEGSPRATYVDLTLNRPGYTGFKGKHVWSLVHRENCMGAELNPLEDFSAATSEDQCTEELTFHRMISGMQTLITIHNSEYHKPVHGLAAFHRHIENLNKENHILSASQFRALYQPSMKQFKELVAVRPTWIANMYFSFGVLLRSFCKLAPILEDCQCNTGNPFEDALAREQLLKVVREKFHTCSDAYNDKALFQRKQELALLQFQNISRILDCMECEKCRLHGKLKILAYQVALKCIGSDSHVAKVERNELIALINSLGYFADGINILDRVEKRLATSGGIILLSSASVTLISIVIGHAYFRRSHT